MTTTASTDAIALTETPAWRRAVVGSLQQLLAAASLIVIVIMFSLLSPNFFTPTNLVTILVAATTVGILAIGTTFVIITGGIDLSIGTGMVLCGVMAGVFITNLGLPVWLGVLLTIAFGGFVGFINGFNIAVLGLPPFIATLGMMMIASGLSLVITGATPIYFSDTPAFGQLMNASLLPGFTLPLGGVIFVLVAMVAAFVLGKTLLGRRAFAIGSNLEATALSGINTRDWLISIYAFSGLFVGLAGVLSAARLSSAQPTGGAGVELQAIAAVIIGGTSLQGGKGTIVGTLIGAFIMAVLTNGLSMTRVPQEWQSVAVGVVVIVAVYIDIVRRRRSQPKS